MAGQAYKVRMADPLLADTLPEPDWKSYFSNISLATQASCASSANTLSLTVANKNTIMTVDGQGDVVPGDMIPPLITPNDRIYDSANDSQRIIPRIVCGCLPLPDKFTGAGMGVASREGTFVRSDSVDRNVGIATAKHCVCPDSLTAFTEIIKGYPAECLFLEPPDGYPTKGIGVSLAEFPNTAENYVGISEITSDSLVIRFSRPYAHVPVFCLTAYYGNISVMEVTPTIARLYRHGSPDQDISFSIMAIGYIA